MPEPIIDPNLPAPQSASPEAPQAPATLPPPEAPAAPETPQLPPALLKVPAIQAVFAGAPPAVSMNLKGSEDRDEVKLLADNKDALTQSGFFFYRSLDGKKGVMANALHIHPEDLQAADRAGKLLTLAPDFDLVDHEVAKQGLNHPVHSMTNVPQAFAAPTPQPPPQAASGRLPLMPPPPAATQNKLATARLANVQPGAPTSGPSPGAGRLLNSVLKGVI